MNARRTPSLLALRHRRQRLDGSHDSRPDSLVGWLGAIQSQDYIGAKWAIGLRAPHLHDADVERAFTDGRILRTHVLRPTWHFVTPADIRWMLALTGPRVQAVNRSYGRRLGISDRTFDRARDVMARALDGGRTLTRSELATALARARIATTRQQLAHIVLDAEVTATICSGPRRGAHFTYALLSDRAPGAQLLSREASVAELARRYFQSHGPATIRDFAWWSGLTMKDAAAGAAMAKAEVLPQPPALDRLRGAGHLLPNYDEYLIAYKDRGAVMDPARSRNLGVFTTAEHPHHVILDGRVAGSWNRTITTTRLIVDVTCYEPPRPAAVRAITTAATRYAQFLGLELDLRWA